MRDFCWEGTCIAKGLSTSSGELILVPSRATHTCTQVPVPSDDATARNCCAVLTPDASTAPLEVEATTILCLANLASEEELNNEEDATDIMVCGDLGLRVSVGCGSVSVHEVV